MKDPLSNPLCQMAWRLSIEVDSFDLPPKNENIVVHFGGVTIVMLPLYRL